MMKEPKRIRSFQFLSCLLLLTFYSFLAHAQVPAPVIAVSNDNGKIDISWSSSYQHVRQIGVQRSLDSMYNFATIGYVRNPDAKINMFTDKNPIIGTVYYKLIIVLQSGNYFFSQPAKIVIDSAGLVAKTAETNGLSVPARTENDLVNKNINKPVNVYHPSIYVYTNADGNVTINLPDAQQKHYSIWFYDSSGVRLFPIDNIRQSFLVIDKSNFLHAGWFHYELFDGEKLKEKWKFFIPDSIKEEEKPHYRGRRKRR